MKKIILWNYERGTMQYDIFCLLIIAFIFLSPKAWFKGGKRNATPTAHLIVQAQDFSPGRAPTKKRIKQPRD